MFTVTEKDIRSILTDFNIKTNHFSFQELQRYDYEKQDPYSKQVRLIIRVDPEDGGSLVIRFKNEDDAPIETVEAQSRFASLLFDHGIETPKVFSSNGFYARRYSINEYEVIVTVESFEDGEIKCVDAETAAMTGSLLAEMHNIAEQTEYHVKSNVLFDPLSSNDLFTFLDFTAYENELISIDKELYNSIVLEYTKLTEQLKPFGKEPKYAVQGDISDCNLYRTKEGKIGVFDFNRCGDNNLYFDAVMQAIFEARLMDYPDKLAGRQEQVILSAFLKGYHQKRPFTDRQKAAFPYLYALVNSFWSNDIKWGEHSLIRSLKCGDRIAAYECMKEIYRRESTLIPMPL